MATPVLDIQNLSKRFGERVLFQDISFSIAEGQRVGLIAQNGTGKSTLLSLLTGDDTPDSGTIIYRNGIRTGFLRQEPRFPKDATVLEACFSGVNPDDDTRLKAKQILTQLRITDMEQPVHQLSGGQQKRVALAQVLISNPDFLILDEPTSIQHANNLYRRELEWMRRQPQARGHKAKYREDAFYELEKLAKTRLEERQVSLKSKNVYIGSKIFESQYVSKAFGEKVILKDFYYNFARFEKMGIVGNNGSGKSTFLKMLLGIVAPDSGRFDIGDTVQFGYFSQDGLQFDEQQKVIDIVRDIAEYIDLGQGRQYSASQLLQHFLFTPEQQYNYVYKLSGGEKRKLYLCTVLMRNPNFLVLDEPTNDLDIKTLQILEDYLQNFPGCVIVVSHDRYFMDKIVDHLLIFHGNGEVQDFPGNYTQYREWKKLQPKAEEVSSSKFQVSGSKGTAASYRNDTRRRLSYKEKQEFQQLERDIEALTLEKAAAEEALSSGTLSVEEITKLSERFQVVTQQLDEKEMRWLELSEYA